LILARFDEGVPAEREPVELVQLVNRAISTSLTVGPDWPVSFNAIEPVEVLGNETQLLRVVDNVLANVRAHTPAGTSTLVRVRKNGDIALMEFSDDGPGMSSHDAARAFDRFYRASEGRDRARGGSGLGLSIVGAIITAHEGSARIVAAPGGGVRVVIELPTAH
jgi:two-component system OmpR family sensor kinase